MNDYLTGLLTGIGVDLEAIVEEDVPEILFEVAEKWKDLDDYTKECISEELFDNVDLMMTDNVVSEICQDLDSCEVCPLENECNQYTEEDFENCPVDCEDCEFFDQCEDSELEDEEDEMELVEVTFLMTDEFGEYRTVHSTLNLGGWRNEDAAEKLVDVFEAFLRANEFTKLMKQKSVRFVENNF